MTLKDHVGRGVKVHFIHYCENELWYRTDTGFEFPVPIADCGNATFLAEDKAILFMRYIRRHMEMLDEARTANSKTNARELRVYQYKTACFTPEERREGELGDILPKQGEYVVQEKYGDGHWKNVTGPWSTQEQADLSLQQISS